MFYYHTAALDGDPALHLALEEYLLDTAGTGDAVFLLYANQPSVVIGKNQNPWLECNMPWLAARGIPVLRRISGGGTVWHDPGNLNYSVIADRSVLDKVDTLDFLCRSLYIKGLPVLANDRGDLLLDGKKISGNALCYRKDFLLHHGTLLVDADLDQLRQALDSSWRQGFTITAPGIPSVRSAVSRLASILPGLDCQGLAAWLVEAWISERGARPLPADALPAPAVLEAMAAKYRDPAWNLDRSSDFAVRYGAFEGTVKAGKIADLPFMEWLARTSQATIYAERKES